MTTRLVLLGLLFLASGLHAAPDDAPREAQPVQKKTSAPRELKGHTIRLSDFGSEDVAYLTLPDVPPTGGIVLIHDQWGLTDAVKATADRLATLGYVVVAVDLYNGKITLDPVLATDYKKDMEPGSALKTLRAGVRFLRESPRFRCPAVATFGWGIGGEYSQKAALSVPGVDAAVVYYGAVETDPGKIGRLKIPLCGIFSTRDPLVPREEVATFAAALHAANNPPEISFVDAAPGFATPGDERYDSGKAGQAWKITTAFIGQKLANPQPSSAGLFDRWFKKDKP